MKKISKQFVLCILFAMLFATLCGCGKNKNVITIDKDAIYREEELNIDFPKGFEPERMYMANDKIFFLGYVYDNITWESKQYWGSMSVDGSDLKMNEIKSSGDGYQYVNSMCVTSDSSIVLNITKYTDIQDGEDYYSEVKQTMDKYSADGKFVKSVDLTEVCGDDDWINNIVDIDGNIVVMLSMKKVVYDYSLNQVKEIKADGYDYYDSFIKLKDGSYAVISWDDMGQALYKYDFSKFELGDKISIPFSFYAYSVYSGGKSGYDLLLRDTTKILGYNIGDSEPKTLINFIDSDIYASYFVLFDAIEGNKFVSVSNDYSGETARIRACQYTKVDPADYVEKKVISLGCLYLWDDLKKDVINFNRTNPDYRISVIDYESYNSSEDWEAGQKKFNSDIVSGNGPDIIIANDSETIMTYANKGLFVDLKKYIEKDPDVDGDDFFPNIIEACSVKGKLYSLSPTFYVSTALAKTSLLNGKTGWTIQEMIDFEKTLPEGSRLFDYSSRNSILTNVLSVSGDTFINEKEAKCNFNSPEFIALLEYLKEIPEDENSGGDIILYDKYIEGDNEDYYTKWRNNKVILSEISISDIRSFNYYEQGTFGEDITFIGYPCADRNGSSLYFSTLYAISAKSGNADAAWEFVKQYFTKEAMAEIEYGFPLSMSRFDELASKAKERQYYLDENGNKVEYDDEYYMNGENIVLNPISDASIAKLKNFILTVNKISTYYQDIIPIIEEETASFFEGEKSAEDVANIIQGRVDIYIKEKQ